MDRSNSRQMLTKPQVQRLKSLTNGLEVGRVLGERVLVKLVEPYTEMDRVEKEGLLYVPDTARDANTPLPTTGFVVAVGWNIPSNARGEPILIEGDMIMFSKYAGTDIFLNEENFRIMDVKEILCTLVETNPTSIAPIVPVNVEAVPLPTEYD